MSMELTLIGDLLVVVETHEDAIAIEKMIGALEAGRISEAEFVDWVCLRMAVAARLEDATA
jgi:hypothetical protein